MNIILSLGKKINPQTLLLMWEKGNFSCWYLHFYSGVQLFILKVFNDWRFFILPSLKVSIEETEAATRGVLYEKVLLEIWQNWQENTCARVSLLITLQAWGLQII